MGRFGRAFRERIRDRKGFTLVELTVVLVILTILAAIMVPTMTGWIDRAKGKQAELNARAVYLAAQTTAAELYAGGDQMEFFDDEAGLSDGVVTVSSRDADGDSVEAQIARLAAVQEEYTAEIHIENGEIVGVVYTPENERLEPVAIGEP
ncbi:MAG: type II secretion system protein [Eubacteriales bacterium]|nr:type II secretion system protein [Eubacteriales bacterium]